MDCAKMRKGTLSAPPNSLKVILLYSKQYYPHLVYLSTTGLWSHHPRVEPFTVFHNFESIFSFI